MAELAARFDVHPNQITQWKNQLVESAESAFGASPENKGPDIKELHAKLGQQALDIDFLAGALGKAEFPGGKK